MTTTREGYEYLNYHNRMQIKSTVKSILCFVLYYLGITHLLLKFYLSKERDLPIVIFVYHRIVENLDSEVNANLTVNHLLKNFRQEMKFLKEWFNIVTLDEAVQNIRRKISPNKPSVVITFDDGFEDNYRLAFPVLKELNIPATIFLTSGLIGTDKLPWVDKIGESIFFTREKQLILNSFSMNTVFNLGSVQDKRNSCEKITIQLKELDYFERMRIAEEIIQKAGNRQTQKRMLNWQEVREMSENNIDFGAHTMTHPILSKMPLDSAKTEINDSKTTIEGKAGIAVKHFAFPNGRKEDFNDELKHYCEEIGFKSVATTIYGNNRIDAADVFALKRLSPGRNMPIFAVDLFRGFLRKD